MDCAPRRMRWSPAKKWAPAMEERRSLEVEGEGEGREEVGVEKEEERMEGR